MDANHEIIIPNKGLPFKMFIFEGQCHLVKLQG